MRIGRTALVVALLLAMAFLLIPSANAQQTLGRHHRYRYGHFRRRGFRCDGQLDRRSDEVQPHADHQFQREATCL